MQYRTGVLALNHYMMKLLKKISIFRKSFRSRLVFAIGLIIFSLLLLYFIFFIQRLSALLTQGLVQRGESIAQNLGFSSELGILAGDPTFVDASATGIVEQNDVVFVGLYNKGGDIIASKGALREAGGLSVAMTDQTFLKKGVIIGQPIINGVGYYEFLAPITIHTSGLAGAGQVIGYSRVIMSLDGIRGETRKLILLYGIVTLLAVAGAGLIAAYFTRRMTGSIDALLLGVRHITTGDFDERIVVQTEDEFGRLALAFNGMAQSLKDAREHEEEISRMKSDFISIVAHQLRTPLTEIKWMLSVVLEKKHKFPQNQIELLEKGYGSTNRMVTLVNGLLNVVRIEEGRFGYTLHPVSIESVVRATVEERRIVAQEKNLTISLHFPKSAMPEVPLDAEKFSWAFANIVDNAIHYTPANGIIDITLTPEEGYLTLSVRDTGIGIPEREKKDIFGKFFRASNAILFAPNGSGLGLFIAKNIIEKHGGSIALESEEGHGTIATIRLPIIKNKETI